MRFVIRGLDFLNTHSHNTIDDKDTLKRQYKTVMREREMQRREEC